MDGMLVCKTQGTLCCYTNVSQSNTKMSLYEKKLLGFDFNVKDITCKMEVEKSPCSRGQQGRLLPARGWSTRGMTTTTSSIRIASACI
jgi:hypothetical protein